MLTKQELQQIGQVVEEKIKPVDKKVVGLDKKVTGLDEKVTGLDKKVTGLDEKVTGLDEKVTEIDERLINLEKGQKALRRIVNKLAKDQSVMLRVLNNESVETRKRVDMVEEHLGLASP